MEDKRRFLTNLFNVEALDKFYEKHIRKCCNFSNYTITTRGTGIGVYVSIQCEDCLESADVSDYDHW